MAERANYIPFQSELCDVPGLRRPDATTGSSGPYRFERGAVHNEANVTADQHIPHIDRPPRGLPPRR